MLDLSKPLRHIETKGRAFVNRDGDNYVVTFLSDDEEEWDVVVWNREPSCIENVPETRELDCWVNVYDDTKKTQCVFTSKDEADVFKCPSGRIACLHIQRTYEVGEGL